MFIVAWEWTPFVMLVLLAGLQSVPDEVLEAARQIGQAAALGVIGVIIAILAARAMLRFTADHTPEEGS